MNIADVVRQFASIVPPAKKWPYRGSHDFVSQHGQLYQAQALPKRFRPGTPQWCFGNSQLLAIKHGLIYVEGFAWTKKLTGLPLEHAWCVEPGSKKVIDVTWHNKCADAAYFGVPFATAYIKRRRRALNGKSFAPALIDDWQNGWPLLTGKAKNWQHQQLVAGR